MKKTAFALTLLLVQACSSLSNNQQKSAQAPLNSNIFEFTFIKKSAHPGDLSGVIWVESLQSYFLVLNKGNLIFEADKNFSLKREISIPGFKDPEDITFIGFDDKQQAMFAIIEEGGTIAVGAIPEEATRVERSEFKSIHFARYGHPPKLWHYNKGAEGITYVPDNAFYIVKEKWPMAILKVPFTTDINDTNDAKVEARPLLNDEEMETLNLLVKDLSAISYDKEKHCLYLLSDESRLLLKFDLRNRTLEEVLTLDGLAQPEGFTILANNQALVVSEPFHGTVVHLQK